jgi:hypothetical protein
MVKIVREDLGTKMIFGLEAQGHRITDLSVASGVGDNRTPVYMREYWSAPCLGMIVSEVIDDPQTGKEIRELVSLSLNEPDPATFRPPKGYKIVAENVTSCAQLSPQ